MSRHTQRKAFVVLVLACLWGSAALAQPAWEVRTFLAPAATATGTTVDAKYLFSQSSIKGRYVCPYCSYSCNVSGACPNPWGISGHAGAVALQDTQGLPLQRLLSLSTPETDNDHCDVQLPVVQASGAIAMSPRAVLGRPFLPTFSTTVQRRSTLHAEAVGVASIASPAPKYGRFLIVPPTPLSKERPAGTNALLVPDRRVTAQVDPGSGGNARSVDKWRPTVLSSDGPGATSIAVGELNKGDGSDNYLQIGVNPYRVDDGDYWLVRYKEHAEDPGTGRVVTQASVEIYSVMYGWQGAMDGTTPKPLVVGDGSTAIGGFFVIADSGAIRLAFSPGSGGNGWSNAVGDNTWVIGFMTRSSCHLVPGWRDMKDPDTDPAWFDLDADTAATTGPTYGKDWSQALLATQGFPGRKNCWFVVDSGRPSFTTESQIGGTEPAPDTTKTNHPLVLPTNVSGVGIVAAEWAGDVTEGSDPDWGWTPASGTVPGTAPFYRSDGEWQYDTYGATYSPFTNAAAATPATSRYTQAGVNHVALMASRFVCSRVEVPSTTVASSSATAERWQPDPNNAAVQPYAEYTMTATGEPADWTYPREVVGWLNDSIITGNFAPGTLAPERQVPLLNRWDDAATTWLCPVCGGHLPPTLISRPRGAPTTSPAPRWWRSCRRAPPAIARAARSGAPPPPSASISACPR